jgi:hypothetical protein
VRLQEVGAVQHVGAQLGLIQPRLQRPPVVVIPRIAPDGEEPIGGEGEEALHRDAPGHVLDVRIEAAILVDHEHGRKRARPRRLHQIAAYLPRVAAREG